jgi:hypothetical protein
VHAVEEDAACKRQREMFGRGSEARSLNVSLEGAGRQPGALSQSKASSVRACNCFCLQSKGLEASPPIGHPGAGKALVMRGYRCTGADHTTKQMAPLGRFQKVSIPTLRLIVGVRLETVGTRDAIGQGSG